MDNEQLISISLKEYLELKELEAHKKKVKIIEKWDSHKNGMYQYTSSNISWMSDGKCWSRLMKKIQKQTGIIIEKISEIKKFESMSVKEFKLYKKGKDNAKESV